MAQSWLSIPSDSPFSLANIPFGIISNSDNSTPRPAIAIGDYALDLAAFASAGGFANIGHLSQQLSKVFAQQTLNDFAALGRPVHREVRQYLQTVFQDGTDNSAVLRDNKDLQKQALLPLSAVQNHLPLRVGDYTDFYVGLNHAYNVGVLFRGPDNALQPNYKHLPVGYHGRASSIVVSGTPVMRPNGQILLNPTAPTKTPVFSPCKKLDIELEMAAFVCTPNRLGEPVPIAKAEDNLFGIVLMNDWSARDIQAWEYVPLGPFNSKNFCTTLSPWVVLMDALEPFRATSNIVDAEGPDYKFLPYLQESRKDTGHDVRLQVEIKTKASGKKQVISKGTMRDLLFSFPQMLTHHTAGGCNLQTGDLLGSGTISGKDTASMGSLLEMTQNGKQPVQLEGGETRMFLEDGDEITLSGVAGSEGQYVGFGECTGVILPAISYS